MPNPIISSAQAATLTPQIIKASGAGKAYQSVAQSAAITVQDGTDYLRRVNLMSSTTVAVCLAQMASNPEENIPKYTPLLAVAQALVPTAAATFVTIGTSAATVLKGFPPTG